MLFYRHLTLVSSHSHFRPSLMYAWCNNSSPLLKNMPISLCYFFFFLKTGCHIAQSGLNFNKKQQRTILKFCPAPWASTSWVLGLCVWLPHPGYVVLRINPPVSHLCNANFLLICHIPSLVISNRIFHNPDIWLSCPNKHFLNGGCSNSFMRQHVSQCSVLDPFPRLVLN